MLTSVDWYGQKRQIKDHSICASPGNVLLLPARLQLTKSTLMTNCLTGLTTSPGLPRTGDHFLRLVCSRVWPRWMDVALFAKQWELAVRSFFAGGSSHACTRATDNNYLLFELNLFYCNFLPFVGEAMVTKSQQSFTSASTSSLYGLYPSSSSSTLPCDSS